MIRTPITYYGGKQNMLVHILPLIPKHSIYTESFAGGLAVFFAKQKVKNEIINDTNAFAMNFYSVLTSEFEALKEKIDKTPYSRVMYKVALSMYEMPHLFTPLQRAWAFFILTNLGFSGRIGSFGCYTKGAKAMGWERKKQLLNKELFDRLQGVQIECTDALKILRLRDSEDSFHYVDPPYHNSNMGHYGGYTEDDFRNLLETLSKLKGKFLLSSYPSDLLSIYANKHGWHQKAIVQRVCANGTKTRKNREKVELLTANYPLKEEQINL